MERTHQAMTENIGQKPYNKKLWNMRNKIETICLAARRAGMLSVTDADYLGILASGARFCKSGAFVNSNTVQFLSQVLERDRSTVNRALRRLELGGWIINLSGKQGQRFHSNGYYHGIDVSPILEREAEIKDYRRIKYQQAVETGQLRDRLKGLKGQLRRQLDRLQEASSQFADKACELLTSIPRRFDRLSLEELQVMVSNIMNMLRSLSIESVGHSQTQHQCCTTGQPNTDTHNKDNLSIKSAKEKHTDETTVNKNEAGAAFDIELSETLKLLTQDEMDDLKTQNPQNAQDMWWILSGYAAHRYHFSGGCQATTQRIFSNLGLNQGTVLLLLVSEAAQRGTVRNTASYALSCARKALKGQFMWGAGVRVAKARMAGESVI